MHVSGVLVVVPVDRLCGALPALAELEGVDVHHTDRASGRIIVTLEADSVAGEVEGLKRIKALPGVVLAEMVHHHFEGHDEPATGADAVPEYLNE